MRPLRNATDSQWQGDRMAPLKSEGATRLLFQNVRGLKKSTREDTLQDLVHLQQRLGIDILGITEHHQDITKLTRKLALSETVHRIAPGQAACRFDSSQEHTDTGHQMGGTGITMIGSLVSKLEAQGRGGDSMGRWSYIHLRRKAAPPITVISAYQVCRQPTNEIGQTAFHQQSRALSIEGRSVHPRAAFITDLTAQIRTFQALGHDIILGGDFNETMEDARSGILRLATATNLSDPWYSRHSDHATFRTHEWGSKRIDAVFLSEGLISCITQLGYAPFDRFLNSDHRGLYIEFDTARLLGTTVDPLPGMAGRSVRTSDKGAVTQFVESTFAHLQANSAFDKIAALDADNLNPAAVERLDNLLGEAGQSGEKHCQRRRSAWFSNELVQARFQVQILRSQLSALKHDKDRLAGLQERLDAVGIQFDIPLTIPATRVALALAEKRLTRKQANSESIRRAEMKAKIDHATDTCDTARARVLQKINKFESGRKTWDTMSRIANSQGNIQRLDRLEIPSSWPDPDANLDGVHDLENPAACSNWRLVTDPTQIEFYLMLRNRIHFGQAQGTPFTVPPLSDDLDWTASSPFVEDVLTGEYTTTVTTAQCESLIQECKATSALDAVPAELTLADFAGKIKTWRESTTTSPSGRHLGRYKALFAAGTYNESTDPQDFQQFESKQKAIAGLIVAITNYCIRNTYVLSRWKSIVNTMIFKDAGEYKIHRLRVIHIYKADFNLVLAVKWRQLLGHADAHGIINDGQYGGRPGCEAQSLTFLEELKYDIAYVSRRSLINFDNDAMSCYDRIIVALASLINRKYGQHRSIVAVHAKTLKEAKYKLRTAIGISDLEYSHCKAFPIHGTGQGSGNSPGIWLFISSTLFDAHAKQAHGATFMTPQGQYSTHLTMVGFVDDSTGTCNDFRPQDETSLDDLLDRMQQDAQLWNDLLFCSGGRLELKKCSYHVLHFTFKPDGTPVVFPNTPDTRIFVNDSLTAEALPIEAKGAREPHKTLGHIKSPAEPQTTIIPATPSSPRALTQIQTLVKKAKTLSVKISMSPIQRYGAFLVYHAMYISSIKYVLPQSFFPQKTLDKAQRQSMGAIIAKCGLARTTPSALVYAPTEYAGGGFVMWYTLQGEGQVLLFIKHWRTGSVISKVLRIDLAWHQWQSGLHQSILLDVSTPLPHLEGRWLPSLRNFLHHIGGSLRVDEDFVSPLQRLGDTHIMQHAVGDETLTDKDIRIINYCRLYLHVVTISDLFNASGTRILTHVWTCSRPAWFDPDTIVTLQRRPSAYQIKHRWQNFLLKWCTNSGYSLPATNLGRWLVPSDQLHLRRESYLVPGPYPILCHWHEGSYWEYRPATHDEQIFSPNRAILWSPTATAIPVDIQPDHDSAVRLQYTVPSPPNLPQTLPIPHDFDDYLAQLPSWEKPLLSNIHFYSGPYAVLEYLANLEPSESLLAVSDGGSIPDVTMSFGVVLGTSAGDPLIENSGLAFGEPSSFRAEGTGQLSALRILYHLVQFTGISLPPQLAIVAISDNAGLVKRDKARITYTGVFPNATLASDWDLTEAIHDTYTALHHDSMSYQWVKGHQDRGNHGSLTTEAKFNIRADELATQELLGHPPNPRLTPFYPRTRCIFDLNGRSVHGHYVAAIRRAAAEPAFFQYLESRHHWSPLTRNTVDWSCFRSASKSYSPSDIHCLKLIHDKLPTKSMKSKMEPWTTAECPHCKAPAETFDHLMQCSNPISISFRTGVSSAIIQYCHQKDAPPAFSVLFNDSISTWLRGEDPTNLHHTIGPSQKAIGWRLLSRGFLSVQWRYWLESTTHSAALAHLSSQCDNDWDSDESELEFYIDCINEDTATQHFTAASDPKLFLSGLIKVIWKELSTLWQQHLDAIHAHDQSKNSPAKRQELVARIRIMQQQRPNVLFEHRTKYFHANLDQYLETASHQQLADYLRTYQPAIAASVRQESKRDTTNPSLLTFLGFTRQRAAPTVSLAPPLDLAEGPNPPHKHSRWRLSSDQGLQSSIRDFFSSLQ